MPCWESSVRSWRSTSPTRPTREPFRRVNFLEDVAIARFVGLRSRGYTLALEELARRWTAGQIPPGASEPDAAAEPMDPERPGA